MSETQQVNWPTLNEFRTRVDARMENFYEKMKIEIIRDVIEAGRETKVCMNCEGTKEVRRRIRKELADLGYWSKFTWHKATYSGWDLYIIVRRSRPLFARLRRFSGPYKLRLFR